MHGLKAPKLGEQLENFLQNTWKTALKKASKGNDHFSELFLKGNSKNNLLCQKNPFLESSIATKHIPPLKFNIQPWKLTCPLKINGWKMYFLLKWSLFGGHVNFQGCRCGYFFGLWGTGVRWPPSDPIHLSGDFTPVARGTHGPPSRRARARAVEAQTARSAAGSVREAENCAWVRIRFRGMVYIYILYIYTYMTGWLDFYGFNDFFRYRNLPIDPSWTFGAELKRCNRCTSNLLRYCRYWETSCFVKGTGMGTWTKHVELFQVFGSGFIFKTLRYQSNSLH